MKDYKVGDKFKDEDEVEYVIEEILKDGTVIGTTENTEYVREKCIPLEFELTKEQFEFYFVNGGWKTRCKCGEWKVCPKCKK